MRILHVSDRHSLFPDISNKKFDLIADTGDSLPNFFYSDRPEAVAQVEWIQDNIECYKRFIGDKPYIFNSGNHDFVSGKYIETILRQHNINAMCTDNEIVTHNYVNFYGFPYINYIVGSWNYELQVPEMKIEVDKLVDVLNNTYIDVLMCHASLSNCLSKEFSSEDYGILALSNAINYRVANDMLPQAMLHGHIHMAHGVSVVKGMLVSNAATVVQIIEI